MFSVVPWSTGTKQPTTELLLASAMLYPPAGLQNPHKKLGVRHTLESYNPIDGKMADGDKSSLELHDQPA